MCGAALAVALACILPSAPADGAERGFSGEIDVDLVEIEAVVRDREGAPVSGLAVDAFTVELDGRPVEVTHFEAHSATAVAAPGLTGTSPDASAPVGHRIALVFDLPHLRREDLSRLLPDLERWISTSVLEGAQAEILVSVLDRSLDILTPFTSSPGAVAAALSRLADRPGRAQLTDGERREIWRQLGLRDASPQELSLRIETFAADREAEAVASLEALRDLAGSLGSLPGRVSLVHISSGLSVRPAEELFLALRRLHPGAVAMRTAGSDTAREFQATSLHAAAAGVAVHAFDASGVRTPTVTSPLYETGRIGPLASVLDGVRGESERAGLRKLAERTGGTLWTNSNDFGRGLRRLSDGWETYYTLGFPAPADSEGRLRDLEVSVEGDGLEVSHRGAIRHRPAGERLPAMLDAALRLGTGAFSGGGAHALRLDIGNSLGAADDAIVPVRVGIPLRDLGFGSGEGIARADVVLWLGVRDERGWEAPTTRLEVPIAIPSDDLPEARGHSFEYRVDLRLRPGRQRLGVALWDPVGRVAAVTTAEVDVAAP